MDLRQLSYFAALFEEGSVTRAAQRMNVVQPALSMQIAKLEKELDQLLFDRQPKAVVPTASGRTLYRLVRPILDDVADVRSVMARRCRGVVGRVTAGILSSLTLSVIPDAVLAFAERYPEVELSLADGYSRDFLEQVADGSLDFAVVNKPARRPGLMMDHLLDEDMVVVGGASSTLPAAVPIRTRDIAGLDLVLPSARHALRQELDRRLVAEDVILTPRLEIDLMSAIADIVGRSSLFTLLPLLAIGRQLAAGTLKAYRLASPRIARQLVVVYRRDVPLSPAAEGFIEILSAELRAAAAALQVHVAASDVAASDIDSPPMTDADARDHRSLFDRGAAER